MSAAREEDQGPGTTDQARGATDRARGATDQARADREQRRAAADVVQSGGPTVGDRLDRELRRMALLHRRSLVGRRLTGIREARLRPPVRPR